MASTTIDMTRSQDTGEHEGSDSRNTLMMLGAVGIIILWWAWSGQPSSSTLRYELAKTAMQFIAVSVLGTLAGLATSKIQKRRDFRQENWRRDVENRRDARARQDILIRSLLQETVSTYNSVKRTRRLLKAETGDGRMTLDVYDKHMSRLIDDQLIFERFKRLAPSITDRRNGSPGSSGDSDMLVLLENYKTAEQYLNTVVKEYEEHRHLLPAESAGVPCGTLPKLAALMDHRGFRPLGDAIEIIIGRLQSKILAPLVIPDLMTEIPSRVP